MQQDGGAVVVGDGGAVHQLCLVAVQARVAQLGLVHQALDVRHLRQAANTVVMLMRRKEEEKEEREEEEEENKKKK